MSVTSPPRTEMTIHGRTLRRDRARAGHDLWVSGALGAAAWAVRSRLAGAPLPAGHPALARLERPVPRVALGLALVFSFAQAPYLMKHMEQPAKDELKAPEPPDAGF